MTVRSLGFADLFLYAMAMALSIRWISVAAAAGPSALPIWGLAIVLFSVPLTLASAELTGRFPGEGGVYAWTADTFGPFWGFLAGWIYWACNLPFFAGLLVFIVNLLAMALGPWGRPILGHPALFMALTAGFAMGIGLLHYRGLGAGKWISNLGGASNLILLVLLVLCAWGVWRAQGSATEFRHPAAYAPPLTADTAILWATTVFAVGGAEALAFLRNDVRGGMRTIFAVLACVAMVQLVFYGVGTGAMLVILSPAAATRLSGLPDALVLALRELGLAPLAPAVLGAAFLCILGSYSSWFGVAARLPFAAGIDAYLPPVFGRRDPKTGAPVAAVLVQTVIVVVLVLLSQAGASLKAAYDFLVAMSVLSYTLPFLFLFAVFLKVARRPADTGVWRAPGGETGRLAVGWLGLAVTLSAVACTLVPSPDAKNPVGEVAKLVIASAVLLGSGSLFYAARRGRRAPSLASP